MSGELKEITHFQSSNFSHFETWFEFQEAPHPIESFTKTNETPRKGPRPLVYKAHQTKPCHHHKTVATLTFCCTTVLTLDFWLMVECSANWVEPAKQFEGRTVRCRDCSLECWEETFRRPGEFLNNTSNFDLNHKQNPSHQRERIVAEMQRYATMKDPRLRWRK